MNGATFRVSEQLMPHILLLPEGTRVLDIRVDTSGGYRDFVVMVEHPDLPELEEGVPWPEVMPTYKRTAKHDHVKFVGWGGESHLGRALSMASKALREDSCLDPIEWNKL